MMMTTPAEPAKRSPTVSAIVPARNEEGLLAACLESLVGQEGVDFEVIVVDDESTDRTREIAQSFSGVNVIEARPLPPGWSGKSNAMFSGAQQARGTWLLFTDADTVHKPGSLARSLEEAKRFGVALLSYSPEQEVRGLWAQAVMTVIFGELACAYRPKDVCDPSKSVAAANGQYMLILRHRYLEVADRAEVRASLLEDVAVAKALKQSGEKIRFRLGADAVRTRMYRNFAELRDGWTKNLALLFPAPGRLAVERLFEFVAILGGAAASVVLFGRGQIVSAILAAAVAGGVYSSFFARVRKAHFHWGATLAALFGLPLFSWLLLRSRRAHRRGEVVWKGRTYGAASGSFAD
ncbi:MAG TPA: glycosyltransferase [Terriglobales bacterium]|nr:glycosyltransferase [Terriglobales bacterium]